MSKLLQILFPSYCSICGLFTQNPYELCSACEKELPILPQPCLCCGLSLPSLLPLEKYCGRCIKKPPPFTQLFALYAYETPVRELIGAMKFHQKLSYTRLFSELLIKKIRQEWYGNQPLPQALIPMPLHTQRLRLRGYNQALEIAKPLSKKLLIPLAHNICQRHKPTAAQTSLKAKERSANVRQAFRLVRPMDTKHVAVIDDVVTTAHTIKSLCSVLKAHGVEKIDVWCCARTGI